MWYDAFVVVVLIFCMIRGAMRGVIWQLAGIAGLVLSLVFAETVSAAASPYVGLAEPLNQWVTMFAAYLVFSFLSFGVARMIQGWMERAKMTEFNRHLGAAFGLLKGVAVCLVLTFFIVTLSADARTMLQHSKSGYAAAVIMDRLHPIMPEKLHDSLDKYIHQLDTPEFPLKHSQDHLHAAGDDSRTAGFPAASGSSETVPPGIGGSRNPADGGIATVSVIDEIVRRIPGFGQEQARSVVEQAYQNAPPDLKSDLVNELKSAAPEMILSVATKWLNQTLQPTADQPASGQPARADDRDGLIREIANGYSSEPSAQAKYVRKIDEWLRGLPDRVTLGVLQDWRADLAGAGTDPDPETTIDTSVDQRIIRQLTIQRVSVFQLSRSLQDRLRAAARR